MQEQQSPQHWQQAIAFGSEAALGRLYDQVLPQLRHWLAGQGGGAEDAQDIFQEAMLVLLARCQSPDFQLTVQPNTYLLAVGKRLWAKQQRGEGRRQRREQVWQAGSRPDTNTEADEKEAALPGLLGRITHQCRRVIEALFLLAWPMQQLMVQMGWRNAHSAANQKFKCLQQLRQQARQKGLLKNAELLG